MALPVLRILSMTLALLCPACLSAQSGDPLTMFSDEDPQMNAAMQQASATLPLFLGNVVDAEGLGDETAAMKVAFPAGEGTEIIWVGPFLMQSDTDLVGILANQPNFIDGYNQFDPIGFTVDMVRDWSYSGQDGVLYGNYTTRVMIPVMDGATQAQLQAVLSPDPVPDDWE